MKFVKKPVVIDAVQWTGENIEEIGAFARSALCAGPDGLPWVGTRGEVEVETLEGEMRASRGDWIIKGIKGEFYPIKDEIFKDSYDEA